MPERHVAVIAPGFVGVFSRARYRWTDAVCDDELILSRTHEIAYLQGGQRATRIVLRDSLSHTMNVNGGERKNTFIDFLL
jgi:hypothetical protein